MFMSKTRNLINVVDFCKERPDSSRQIQYYDGGVSLLSVNVCADHYLMKFLGLVVGVVCLEEGVSVPSSCSLSVSMVE